MLFSLSIISPLRIRSTFPSLLSENEKCRFSFTKFQAINCLLYLDTTEFILFAVANLSWLNDSDLTLQGWYWGSSQKTCGLERKRFCLWLIEACLRESSSFLRLFYVVPFHFVFECCDCESLCEPVLIGRVREVVFAYGTAEGEAGFLCCMDSPERATPLCVSHCHLSFLDGCFKVR